MHVPGVALTSLGPCMVLSLLLPFPLSPFPLPPPSEFPPAVIAGAEQPQHRHIMEEGTAITTQQPRIFDSSPKPSPHQTLQMQCSP